MAQRGPKHQRRTNQHTKKTLPAGQLATAGGAETPPETLVPVLAARLQAGDSLEELAGEIVQTAPAGAQAQVLDQLAAQVERERFVALLGVVLQQPVDPAALKYGIRTLEHSTLPAALETLVALGAQTTSKPVRHEARVALHRLRESGVQFPEPDVSAPKIDVASWPVVHAWANRFDHIGSQAVMLTRRRSQGDLAYFSVVVSDDRGIVDGWGELGVSANTVKRRMERFTEPPGALSYEVSPEYVLWRIRQGEDTSFQAGRELAPDYLRWSYLLEGLDNSWEPDLGALCREHADPSWLERTSVLMYATDFMDWWPDIQGKDGWLVRRYIEEITQALDRLPDRGRVPSHLMPDPPPYLELLAPETHYVAMLWPFSSRGSTIIEKSIDQHLGCMLPAERVQRYHQALLQMGYLTLTNDKPTLGRLIMTAAWGLDARSNLQPRRHPFLRQMLRKAAEILIAG